MSKKLDSFRSTHLLLGGALLLTATACGGQKWSEVEKDSIRIVTQPGGPTLGYSATSGVQLLTVNGFAFKE